VVIANPSDGSCVTFGNGVTCRSGRGRLVDSALPGIIIPNPWLFYAAMQHSAFLRDCKFFVQRNKIARG
jgi:hypothetical protein